MDSMVSRYWWGHSNNTRKIHWKSWEALCTPKWVGGLGFRKLAAFNKAMLAKQGWRLLKFPNSLLASLLRAKYYLHADFLSSSIGSNPSFTWCSIFDAKPLL
ncbi:uncharacterized protein LOC114281631 [Camellia sinensis]|uniref:uncharacterized protein LOC114281631 n=1 Tax=Camellia sinensis TaxID=4442 RepID=UPI001036C387|nr:uncharacterized protein LOC114281631 [Camellia sinensis]